MASVKTKVCSRCEKRKKLSKFARSSRTKSGVQAWCLECMREYQRAWRKANPGRG